MHLFFFVSMLWLSMAHCMLQGSQALPLVTVTVTATGRQGTASRTPLSTTLRQPAQPRLSRHCVPPGACS